MLVSSDVTDGTDVRAEELGFDDRRSIRQLAHQEGKGG